MADWAKVTLGVLLAIIFISIYPIAIGVICHYLLGLSWSVSIGIALLLSLITTNIKVN